MAEGKRDEDVRQEDSLRIVFSQSERRPGCVLLQAALGGTVPRAVFLNLFPAETWLVAPTDDMHVYLVNRKTLRRIAEVVRKERT